MLFINQSNGCFWKFCSSCKRQRISRRMLVLRCSNVVGLLIQIPRKHPLVLNLIIMALTLPWLNMNFSRKTSNFARDMWHVPTSYRNHIHIVHINTIVFVPKIIGNDVFIAITVALNKLKFPNDPLKRSDVFWLKTIKHAHLYIYMYHVYSPFVKLFTLPK